MKKMSFVILPAIPVSFNKLFTIVFGLYTVDSQVVPVVFCVNGSARMSGEYTTNLSCVGA